MLLSLVAGLGALHAQETGLTKAFKVRLGYTPNPKDHLRSAYTGFGLDLRYGLPAGRIGLELGYFYQTGDNHFGLPDDGRLPAGALPMNPAKSMEDKRNQLAGFSVRATFSRPLGGAWDWQVGLQLGSRFTHQYVGDAQSTAWGTASGTAAWRDFYIGAPAEGGLNPSPFGGVTWKVDSDSSVEFNVTLVSYQALEYRHVAGTGNPYVTGDPGRRSTAATAFPLDTLAKTRRMVPCAEVAYVFHF